MAKFYVSGTTSDSCVIQIFTTEDHNYIGQRSINAGSYEVVFELDVLENVDIWSKRADGYSNSYVNIIPLDGSAKDVNITYEYTEIYGGNASTY